MESKILELMAGIKAYAGSQDYESVLKALSLIDRAMTERDRSESVQKRLYSDVLHGMEVAEMIINLNAKITKEEEDSLVAAVLLHVFPENASIEDFIDKIRDYWGFNETVCDIVETIAIDSDPTDKEQNEFYERVRKNRLALLAVLADRGIVVSGLYRLSSWNAHRYIDETKACYYPLGIYGKEHYHELLAPFSVLMEKMRTLIEVSEILLRRYEARESELIQDILAIREENATLKGIITKFRKDKERERYKNYLGF